MRALIRHDETYGIPVMKFTLTYDGPLSSAGNGSKKTKEKSEIRSQFSPQLEELWKIHPALKRAVDNSIILRNDRPMWDDERHHQEPQIAPPRRIVTDPQNEVDLCGPIVISGQPFFPLVRDSYALVCSLDILFLRKDAPGHVYQGGDLDNRIKTLLDALSVPNQDQVKGPPSDSGIFCLLENDRLVTGLSVKSERLLIKKGAPDNEVRLIIEVDVRVTDARSYNTLFLGD